MVRVGVIGLGYWGPNIVRNFHGAEGCRVKKICDTSEESFEACPAELSGYRKDLRLEGACFRNPSIDAIAIATPVSTHFSVAKMALDEREACFRREALH